MSRRSLRPAMAARRVPRGRPFRATPSLSVRANRRPHEIGQLVFLDCRVNTRPFVSDEWRANSPRPYSAPIHSLLANADIVVANWVTPVAGDWKSSGAMPRRLAVDSIGAPIVRISFG
ncbi:hypothetical protein [Chitiniphilus shinanonensis]|uniref:hypothetical protein n=1 Tax=Chitiniphilus shinanonensis TaxID=553088 RepID=UPI00333F3403